MEKNKQYILSVWKRSHQHVAYNSLKDIYCAIYTQRYANTVVRVRRSLAAGNDYNTRLAKNELLAFTASGTFYENEERRIENLIQYTGLMVLHIDKLESREKVKEIFSKVILVNYTRMAFISPSGWGIKIIVATNNIYPEQHSYLYKQLLKFYKEILQVELNEKTCDLTSLCYLSSDLNIYYKTKSKIYEFEEVKEHNITEHLVNELNIKDFYINKVAESLPKDLTDIVENLETEKEKDAFFVGILSAVEILFKNLSVK